MLDVTSPFDGALIKSIKTQSADDADRMLERASYLFKQRDGWLSPHQRISILKKLAQLVENEAEDFALLIAQEGGKPLIDARVEVARAVDGIYLAAKELPHVTRGEEIPMGLTPATEGRQASTVYEPIGVVLALSAFNHPLNLIVHQVIPAVAVGCPVIVKPATNTPLNCLRLCELLSEAGLPEGWCQAIVCDNTVAERLVTSKQINFMTFIGSARVGWMLKSKLAPGVRCALEHGGVAPVIVDSKVDLDAIVPLLSKGGFYHAGQVCVSVQRIYAPEEDAKELAYKLAEHAQKLMVGPATSDTTDVGPLIQPREVERVHSWVTEAVDAGGELVCGGLKLADNPYGSTYTPTVILNPPHDAKVSISEVFGPVVCVYGYKDISDAIERANGLDVAFQASVFSQDINVAHDTARRLDASAVMINDHTAFRSDWMPFAGRRASGYGVGGIGYTMHDMVQLKMTVINNL